jgi:hypothetical protein
LLLLFGSLQDILCREMLQNGNPSEFWDTTAHVASVLAVFAGAVWAYFKFIKSRTFYPRMQMTCSGTLLKSGNVVYVVPRV